MLRLPRILVSSHNVIQANARTNQANQLFKWSPCAGNQFFVCVYALVGFLWI